jgi:PII-like signaling protein
MHGLTGERTLMRIHIGERDRYHGKPLYEAIVLRLSLDLPLVVECVDTEERIQAVLPELDGMIGGGLITLERAQVIMYRGDSAGEHGA